MNNYRLTGLTPSQKEDGFFVFEQFNELMKNALGEEREVQLCGSAVTGWGSDGSDLDLSLKQLNRDNPREILSHLHKKILSEKMLFESAHSLLGAKVPVLSFQHRFIPIYGDLTMANMANVLQSEISYFYAALSPDIVPVYIAIKQLLKKKNICASYQPGYFSSFQIKMIYLFYLMQRNVIPSFKLLFEQFKGRDLGDVLPEELTNFDRKEIELDDLFCGFFDFIAGFDFDRKRMDPLSGEIIPKSFLSSPKAVFVMNPIENDINICRSVNKAKRDELRGLASIIGKQNFRNLIEYFAITWNRSAAQNFDSGGTESRVLKLTKSLSKTF